MACPPLGVRDHKSCDRLLVEGFPGLCYNFGGTPVGEQPVAEWCNGSTTDSESVSLGSNPSSAARLVAHSSSGPGRRPLKAEITGSNPVCATTFYTRNGPPGPFFCDQMATNLKFTGI